MSHYYRKFYLFFAFLSVIPLNYGMQAEGGNSSKFNILQAAITGFFAIGLPVTCNFFKHVTTKFLPRFGLSSLNPFSNYKFRKTNQNSNNIENEKLVNIIRAVQKADKITEKSWQEIQECLENGADPKIKIGEDEEPLITVVARHGNENHCNYLLEKKADINACDKKGNTVLHATCRHSGTNVPANYWLQHGADANISNNEEKEYNTPLLIALVNKKEVDVVKSLIASQADINCQDPFGNSPLQLAVRCSMWNLIPTLCNAGPSLTQKDNKGNTIFDILTGKSLMTYIVITYTRLNFDDFKNPQIKREDEIKGLQIEENDTTARTMKIILLCFNRVNNDMNSDLYQKIPTEISHLILSYTFSTDNNHSKLLYNALLDKKYFKPRFLVNNHVSCLKKIVDSIKKTKSKQYEKEKLLPIKNRLEQDLEIFNNNYPHLAAISTANWAATIYEIQYKPQLK